MSLIKKVSSVALCIFLLSGCATISEQSPIKLPSGLEEYFDVCRSADGAMAMRIYEGEDLRLTSEVEWSSTSAGNWKLDLISPMGQVMAGMRYENNAITGTGQIAGKMPLIKIRKDGFLDVDDNLVAIKPAEIACIWKNKIPVSWVPDLYHFENSDADKTQLNFADGTRAIQILLNNSRESTVQNCAVIKWRQYWGLVTSELNWCFSKNKAAISGLGDIKLSWIELNE